MGYSRFNKKFLPSHSVPKTPPAPCSALLVSRDFLETWVHFRHQEVYNTDFGIQQAGDAKNLAGFRGSQTTQSSDAAAEGAAAKRRSLVQSERCKRQNAVPPSDDFSRRARRRTRRIATNKKRTTS